MRTDGQPRSVDGGQTCDPRPIPRWISWATLALLLLTASGCQAGANLPTGAAITEALPTQTSNPAPSAALALLGDVMLGRAVHPSPETFTYLQPFLTSADLALANLESPLTNSPVETGSPYELCAPPGNVRYLVDADFDLLALSNNHSLDCGVEGLTETQRTLTDAGLDFIGPEPEPVYRSVNGVHLAFLAFDATGQFNIETAVQAVRSARAEGAIVVVSIHWGVEYQTGASTGQKEIADHLADAGAALIWGHHPHVLQPAEWINNGTTLVLYSLANALFDQYGLDNIRRSALVIVTLDSNGVEEFRVIPFLIDIRNSRIIKAEPEDAQLIMRYFE